MFTMMQIKLFVPSHCLSKVNCCLFVTDWPFLFISFTFFKEMRFPVFHMHSYELNLGLCMCVCTGLLSLSLQWGLCQLWWDLKNLFWFNFGFMVSLKGPQVFVVFSYWTLGIGHWVNGLHWRDLKFCGLHWRDLSFCGIH